MRTTRRPRTDSPEFHAGRGSYESGVLREHNPFDPRRAAQARADWFAGWDNALERDT